MNIVSSTDAADAADEDGHAASTLLLAPTAAFVVARRRRRSSLVSLAMVTLVSLHSLVSFSWQTPRREDVGWAARPCLPLLSRQSALWEHSANASLADYHHQHPSPGSSSSSPKHLRRLHLSDKLLSLWLAFFKQC
ncbi:hypothetical protein TYRP_018090 [Tyrophagus putrescentiae]|nr:hypothetical protein TYRP_018090 [Tyrophagus putrescentiae]